MPFTFAALKTELETDPAALGYAALLAVGNDRGLAEALNLVRSGAPYRVSREPISTAVLFSAVDPAEFAALTTLQLAQLQTILAAGTINMADASTRGCIQVVFPAATAPKTRAALVALAQRDGSRAEALWGTGTAITADDIAKALRGA